jgi:GTP-binding protein
VISVKSAEFVTSAVKPAQYPEGDYPEVAFAGRSNVGKSSLINKLVNRKGLVKTSSTPGRTQLINFFLINQALSLVDLPGYGYAKVPARIRADWGPMVRTYLEQRKNLKGVVLLQDLRRRPKDIDLDFMAWLRENNLPCVLVATKTDKVKSSVKTKTLKSLLGALPPEAPRPILFSALTGRGKEELWAAVSELLSA